MLIIPLNLDSVLLFLHNSKLAYSRPHHGQTSEHAREIARGSHRAIRKTLHVAVTTSASSCELEAKFSVVLAGLLHFAKEKYFCLYYLFVCFRINYHYV